MFLISFSHVQAQLSLSDLIRLGSMHYLAYNVNPRSFIDAKDTLQLRGYPLMRFESSTSASGDTFYAFFFQKSGNEKEKIIIRNQNVNVDGKKKTVFQTTVTTSDIDQFNAMLKNAMKHPNFDIGSPSLLGNTFVSKKSPGVNEQITFSKNYSVSPNGEVNIQVPILYTINFTREK